MKKILIALVVLVGFAGTAAAQSKVAHVKSQVLWDTLSYSKTAEKQMLEFQQSLAAEIQELGADIQELYTQYEKIVNDPNASQVIRQVKEKQIQEKEQEYQNRQQSAQFEMQALRNELEAPIEKMIRDAVAVVAKRDKYDYIMDINSAVFVNPDNDVTDTVMTELLKLEKEEMAKASTGGAQ